MRERIISELRAIEERENARVLLAVESGSRAWGFASPDSDYDVRFIYARQKADYLRLDPLRDVIERPIDAVLDMNGWDLQKALKLLRGSNPTLLEWAASPVVYVETDFAARFRAVARDYFSVKRSLYHYISMAEGNNRDHLRRDMVRAKKYFYVLRPLLACRWILDRSTPPPMCFAELMDAELPAFLKTDVERLLDIKMNAPEIREIPRIDRLNAYLDAAIEEVRGTVASMEDQPRGWQELNRLFVNEVV